MITVLVVDDHPLVLEALRQQIASRAEFEVHGAANLSEARDAIDRVKPRVVVCDVRLPDGSGLQLIKESQAGKGTIDFLVLSSFDTPQYVITAKRLGAAGYLLKTEPIEAIVAAIHKIARGGTFFGGLVAVNSFDIGLTEREKLVVSGVIAGETNDEIAARLGISRRGVEAHLSHIYARAEVASRTELAVRAQREDWLEGLP